MQNQEVIKSKLIELGYKVGCMNNLDMIPKSKLNTVIESLDYEYTDLFLTNRSKLLVVEISTVDNEKDITVMDATEYFSQYGNLEDAYDLGKITEKQYNKLLELV